jgi:hypothetical protein
MQRFDASAFNTRLEVAKAIAAHPQIGPMIADLQKIKEVTKTLVNTNGRPLGAHPGLVAEVQKGANSSQPGPIAQSIQSFLTNHLSSFHLSNISFMGLNNGGPEPWLFFGGDMGLAATGPATPTFVQTAIGREWIPHKNLTYRLKGVFPSEQPPGPEKAIALSFITNDAVIPAPKAVGHLAGLFGPNDVIDSNPAHMVDNPNLIHNFNADCVSCHVGTTRMNTLTQADNLTLTAKATDPNRFKTVPGISGYVDPAFMSLTQWNVRNFGFFAEANDPEARPKVTFRVLNESIDSTELTNQAIFSVANDDLSALKHPGLTCPDDNGVWTCALTNARDCFSSCNVAKTNEPAPAPIASPKVGDGDGKRPNPGGQDPVPNNPPATCNLTTSPAQVRGPNGNVIFTAKAGVSLSMVTMPNTPQGSIGVAVDIFVRDDLLTCDPNELCRAFPEPAPNTDQKDALLPIHFNNNGAKGADLGTAKNAAFLGTLKPTEDRKNRTGVISGFVSSTSCK